MRVRPAGGCVTLGLPAPPCWELKASVARLVEGLILETEGSSKILKLSHLNSRGSKVTFRAGILASDSAPRAPWSFWQRRRHHLLAEQPAVPAQGHCQLHPLVSITPTCLRTCRPWA